MNIRPISRIVRFALGLALLSGLVLGTSSRAHAGGLCYVDASATGGDNGNTWEDAYTDLQSAFEALSCNEVWVAAGAYKPTAGTDRAISFVLRNSLAIYGGFAGTEMELSQRNPAVNVTILTGEIGSPATTYDNSYHVVRSSAVNGTAVLDGVTITAGHVSDQPPDIYGAGMYNESSSPILTNVTFRDNIAVFEDLYGKGGGIYNHHSSPALFNVLFLNNWADDGGGMFNDDFSSPSLQHVTFRQNVGLIRGGGMSNASNSSPGLKDVDFDHNQANFGSGMLNIGGSNPALMNVTFHGGWGEAGSGMLNYQSSPTLVNVTFTNNTVLGGFGQGGAMLNTQSRPSLTNVTISGNFSDDPGGGGGIYNNQSSPIITNSIIHGNTEGNIVDQASAPVVTYSIVQGGYPGTGNLDADPLLGPLQNNGGFTLTMALAYSSPAIDAGSDSVCPPEDQRGVVRPQGAHCDMGAFEYSAPAIRTRRLLSIAAQDGWVLESAEDSAVGRSKNAAAQTFRLGDDASDRQYRTFLSFDTSALPDNAIITGAVLRIRRQGLTGTDPFMTHGSLRADIRKGAFSNNAALERIDFSASASRGAVASFGRLPSNGWYTATLGSGALAYINKAGITQFRLRFSLDDNDDRGADFMQFYSGDAASNRPMLILTYYLP